MNTFIEQLTTRFTEHNTLLCVGLDPDPERFPDFILEQEYPIFTFCQAIVDATHAYACAFKPQIAYFSALGAEDELEMLLDYIHEYYSDIPLILDAKRGDIGTTAEKYAMEAFERYGADALTVNPYLGADSIKPYLEYEDVGVFVLCHTSNPGAPKIQQLKCNDRPLYEHVARMCADLNQDNNIGLVVGATQVDVLKHVRQIAPTMPILVPGVGAQGGDVQAVVKAGCNAEGHGLLINASRSIMYAGKGNQFANAAKAAAKALCEEINAARG